MPRPTPHGAPAAELPPGVAFAGFQMKRKGRLSVADAVGVAGGEAEWNTVCRQTASLQKVRSAARGTQAEHGGLVTAAPRGRAAWQPESALACAEVGACGLSHGAGGRGVVGSTPRRQACTLTLCAAGAAQDAEGRWRPKEFIFKVKAFDRAGSYQHGRCAAGDGALRCDEGCAAGVP